MAQALREWVLWQDEQTIPKEDKLVYWRSLNAMVIMLNAMYEVFYITNQRSDLLKAYLDSFRPLDTARRYYSLKHGGAIARIGTLYYHCMRWSPEEDIQAQVREGRCPGTHLNKLPHRSRKEHKLPRGWCQNTLTARSKSPHLGGRRHAKTRGRMSEFPN